jgi:hypothetical protein
MREKELAEVSGQFSVKENDWFTANYRLTTDDLFIDFPHKDG